MLMPTTLSVQLFDAAISTLTTVKLPLDGLLVVIMVILAHKGYPFRAATLILFLHRVVILIQYFAGFFLT